MLYVIGLKEYSGQQRKLMSRFLIKLERELLNTVKARKLAYYGHTIGKHGIAWRKR